MSVAAGIAIAVIIGCIAVYIGILGVRDWFLHRAAKQVTEKEMTKIFTQAKTETEALKDPKAPIDLKEATNELRKTRDRGRAPD